MAQGMPRSLALALVVIAAAGVGWTLFDGRFTPPPPTVALLAGAAAVGEAPRLSVPPDGAATRLVADGLAAVIEARRSEIYDDPQAPVGGNPEGDVTIVEFFDYNCPYCREVAAVLEELVSSDPGVRIVFKEYPILGPGLVVAARAALAAQRQGKYLELHDMLLLGRRVADEAMVLQAAGIAGLDVARLRADMDDPAIQAAIERNLELAAALGIRGTPAFIIGDKLYAGAAGIEDFRSVVGQVRQQ